MRAKSLSLLFVAGYLLWPAGAGTWADEQSLPLKAGIIGLDAHALPWTKIINDPQATGELADMVVVAGYPGGSPDIPQSMELLARARGRFPSWASRSSTRSTSCSRRSTW